MRKLLFVALMCFALINFLPVAKAELTDEVVAVVNDEVITLKELEQKVKFYYIQLSKIYEGEELHKQLAEARKRALKLLIENELILQKAKEYEVEVSDIELSEKIKDIKEKFPSEEIFNRKLEAEGVTLKQFEEKYKEQMMMERLVSAAVRSKSKPGPTEIFEYYQQNKEKFIKGPEYKIRQLLIKFGKERTKEEALKICQTIQEELNKGALFEDVVRKYSEGPFIDKGGLMDSVKPGNLKPELDRAMLSLKEGEVSEAIQTDLGFHVIKLEEIRLPRTFTFDEAEFQIRDTLTKQKYQETYKKWIEELEKDAYISIKKEF